MKFDMERLKVGLAAFTSTRFVACFSAALALVLLMLGGQLSGEVGAPVLLGVVGIYVGGRTMRPGQKGESVEALGSLLVGELLNLAPLLAGYLSERSYGPDGPSPPPPENGQWEFVPDEVPYDVEDGEPPVDDRWVPDGGRE